MFVCVLYHPPNISDSIYISLSEHGLTFIYSSQLSSSFVVISICHCANWLGVATSLTSHGTAAKDFCDGMGLIQPVNLPTRISVNGKSSLLDFVLTNFPTNVSCSSAPIG